MSQGIPSTYGEPLDCDFRCKLTKTQRDYIRAHAAIDNKEMQEVIRQMIEHAYAFEKGNGIDIIAVARENRLL